MFAPGVPDIMREFNSNNENIATFVVSVYVLGFAFGPLFAAPLSEIYGRAPVFNIANVLFVLATVGTALSQNMPMLIVFRFLMGFTGSTPITNGSGTISDMFPVEERGKAMAVWAMGPLLGPCIGPLAGGYMVQSIGWRWVFWVIAIFVSLLHAFRGTRTNILYIGWCSSGCLLLFFSRDISLYSPHRKSQPSQERDGQQ